MKSNNDLSLTGDSPSVAPNTLTDQQILSNGFKHSSACLITDAASNNQNSIAPRDNELEDGSNIFLTSSTQAEDEKNCRSEHHIIPNSWKHSPSLKGNDVPYRCLVTGVNNELTEESDIFLTSSKQAEDEENPRAEHHLLPNSCRPAPKGNVDSGKQCLVTDGDNELVEESIFLCSSKQSENEENLTPHYDVKFAKEADCNSNASPVPMSNNASFYSSSIVLPEPSAERNKDLDSSSLGCDKSMIQEDRIQLESCGNDKSEQLPPHQKCLSELRENNTCCETRHIPTDAESVNQDSVSSVYKLSNVCSQELSLPGHSPSFSNHNHTETLGHQLDCEKKPNGSNKMDPFDLFSDEDTEPKRYQPIKRKLSQAKLAPDQTSNDSNPDSDTMNMLPETMEMVDCKKIKLTGRVAYVHSEELLKKVNQLTRIEGRADLVHSLVQAYGLLQYVDVVPPRAATESEILGFHSADYIDFLKDVSTVSDVEENTEDPNKLYAEAEAYGLSYDCPLQDGIFETASLISGASIVAADTLISGQANMAINWYGGWHHAKRDAASGFCYINDIVLAILKLRQKFDKVLYVDIDLHHGDGVEEAFSLTSKVMTVSFHKYATGFFPGSGAITSIGQSRGKFYAVNVPLHDGIKDAEFCSVFYRVMKMVKEKFSPEAVVLQCGADGLSEDHMASFNLTHIGLAKCVCFVLAWGLPTLLLGGGGYNFASTSKCWTFLTALVARRKLPLEIPEHENLLAYGPDYQMATTAGNRRDCNSKQYLMNLIAKVSRNLESI